MLSNNQTYDPGNHISKPMNKGDPGSAHMTHMTSL